VATKSIGCAGTPVAESHSERKDQKEVIMADKAKEKESESIAPWRPFMDVTLFERDMERMMDDFFSRRTRPWWPERRFWTEGFEIGWSAEDLYEEKDDIVVKAELAVWRKTTSK
jgi:hypothetical protein